MTRLNARAGSFALMLAVALALPAHAYIDPGSGALVIQALVSALVGALFFARSYLMRIARSFRRLLGGKDGAGSDPTKPVS